MNSNKLPLSLTLAFAFALGVMVFGDRRVQAAPSTWFVSPTGTASGVSGGSCASPSFNTIGAAIAAASDGDTIQVCVGTYNEQVQVSKTLTLKGANAGLDARTRSTANESIIDNICGPVQIMADKVVLDGFTIQGSTLSDPCFISGVWTNPGFSGTQGGHQILNNIIQNNVAGIELDNTGTFQTRVQFNLIQNNNNPGPNSGDGIEVSFGLNNALIDSNRFVGNQNSAADIFTASGVTISGNEFASNRRAIGLGAVVSSSISGNNTHNSTGADTADIRIFGSVTTLSITCNNLAAGAGRAIRISDACGGTCPNSSININDNNISGYPIAGLQVDSGSYAGGFASLNAKNNWWSSSTGPTIASNPGGTGEPIIDPDGVVNYTPFRANLSPCASATVIGPPTNKDQCKKDGWMNFTVPRKFKNQGDCIQFVNTGK